MSLSPVTLVVIDDDPQSLALVTAALEQDGLEIVTEQDPVRGAALVRQVRPAIVLVDLVMPGMSGMEVLAHIVETDPSIDVILMTSHYSTETAVQAIQQGACDYFDKPINVERLQARVDLLISEARHRTRARMLDREMVGEFRFEGIIGRSPLMLDVFARIRRVAPHFRTALITGSSGTGKELVAKALHKRSPVGTGPLVVCNCAAIAENLMESELFGHVRGAFTGASSDRAGLFEHANNGVLFLDEIGELSMAAQAKLLRVVQEQEVQRVGSPAVRRINVRIIAATNRDLRGAVRTKEFRDDLFFRLSMVEIRLPALAERREDLPLLMRHFVDVFAQQYGKAIEGLTRRAEALLTRYSWPGNIRELENVLGYACMICDSARIDIHDLPDSFSAGGETGAQANEEPLAWPSVSMDEIGWRHARRVLEMNGDEKVRTAEILGVSRATLYRLLAAGSEGSISG